MDKKESEQQKTGLNRRRFISALGAAATAGAILDTVGGAKSGAAPVAYFQDSHGNILPYSPLAQALGIAPPPISGHVPSAQNGAAAGEQENVRPDSCAAPTGTYYSSGYPNYNILLVMVDQMRAATFWPPQNADGTPDQGALYAATPNVTSLMNQSWVFPNYYTAATRCSPARATLLTGLYAQQTCMFKTQDPEWNSSGGVPAPSLLPYNPAWPTSGQPGFPTIGNVLAQSLPVGSATSKTYGSYDTAWIGKWHLSCDTVGGSQPGANGPTDYGFTNPLCLPTSSKTAWPPVTNGCPSPNGMMNEGNGGDFLDSYTTSTSNSSAHNVPAFATSLVGTTPPPKYVQINDAAVAAAFAYWLQCGAVNGPNQKWFCAVSFTNPHDMTDFPYAFGLTTGVTCPGSPEPDFCPPSDARNTGFFPPPTGSPGSGITYAGAECKTYCPSQNPPYFSDQATIPGLNPNLYTQAPAGWNNLVPGDDPIQFPYGYDQIPNTTTYVYGKPGLQAYYENNVNIAAGWVNTQHGWLTFLNYYFWMQSCVDTQIGQVLYGNNGVGGLKNSPFWNNTLIIFLSDHGEFGGSHNLHAKGGALYDEVMNVPLYISFPEQRLSGQTAPVALPFVCSSVDILPFLYRIALGNDNWRGNTADMIYYLNGREAIYDAIGNSTKPTAQRRLSVRPLANPFKYNNGTQTESYQPYILHTTDEYNAVQIPGTLTPQPSHAIAYRTVDTTTNYTPSSAFPASYPPPYGGGKLGMYSSWDVCNPNPTSPTCAPVLPDTAKSQQYEFYNYSPASQPPQSGGLSANPGELCNSAFAGGGSMKLGSQAAAYLNDFNRTAVQNELYYPAQKLCSPLPAGSSWPQVAAAIAVAFCNYVAYLNGQGQLGCHSGESSGCLA